MSYQDHAQKLMNTFPGIIDLEKKARKRIPFVAWEYLETGTGDEKVINRNRKRLDDIALIPRFVRGKLDMDTSTSILGKTYNAPFGVAPVGLTGLVWPKAEILLADTAARYKIPYCLSTVATRIPEEVGPFVGEMGWFQLYPPKDPELRKNLLQRARDNGFHTLVITADVPAPGRRERTQRAGLKTPPKITPRFVWQGMMHPVWSLETIRAGLPRLRTVASYSPSKDLKTVEEFVRFKFRGDLTWDYIKEVRDLWEGPIILKGILHPEDATLAIAAGMDGIAVSNHGGRQFDGAPAAIDMLPKIAAVAKGKATVLFDSGVRSGLDIVKALVRGADFVLLGRAFMYGVAALGQLGADHAAEILLAELKVNMAQLGVKDIAELKKFTEELEGHSEMKKDLEGKMD